MMGKSVEKNRVAPAQFVDNPQSHFSKIRLEDDYHVEHNGKHIKTNRVITTDVSDRIKLFHLSNQKIDTEQDNDGSDEQ